MTDPAYVKKSAVRGLVIALFIFNLAVLAAGLQFDKSYATDQASKKAAVVARETSAADRYALNRTTCALRALAQPSLESYRKAAKDKTLSPSARHRNELRVLQTEKFLAAYATIPPDFNCKLLPKHPPKFTP